MPDVDQALAGRAATIGFALATDLITHEALLAGVAVPRSKLKPEALKRLGELTTGPDYAIDPERIDEIALRLSVTQNGSDPTYAESIFPGLTYADMLEATVDRSSELVTDLIEVATVGTIASVPELGKSFLAMEIGHKVAAGGSVLGAHPVIKTGPVAYWWQDDSRANELLRLQQYAEKHGHTKDKPPGITFHLNEGLQLPDHLPALRAEVEAMSQILVVLDSLYNFMPHADLKDEAVGAVFGQLKNDLCDPTGCTVLIVDHAPWPTEASRSHRGRAYGSVFKGAAIRWGIYLEPEGKTKTYISARGNNVKGLKRTPCYFDPDLLELKIVEPKDHDEALEERIDQVRTYLQDHPGRHSSTSVREAVGGRSKVTDEALIVLKDRDEVVESGTGSGRRGTARYWEASNHAGSTPSPELWDEVGRGVTSPELSTTPSRPYIEGRGLDGTRSDGNGSADPDADIPF